MQEGPWPIACKVICEARAIAMRERMPARFGGVKKVGKV